MLSPLDSPSARRRWAWLTLLLLVYVSWEALSPSAKGLGMQHFDKVLHVSAFTTLALTASLSLPAMSRVALSVAAALLAYGGLIEILQRYIPGRDASWGDLAADLCGIALGMGLATLARRRLLPKK